MRARISPRFQSGISVLELMIVIAIIGVLAVLLFPASKSATSKAQSTQCLSNLRNMGRAAMLYAMEHRGDLPPSYGPGGAPGSGTIIFYRLLNEYLCTYDSNATIDQFAKTYKCPSDKEPFFLGIASYGCNMYLGTATESHATSGNTYQLDSNPKMRRSEIILFIDSGRDTLRPGWGENYEKVVYRHGQNCNAVMMDGSAARAFSKADNLIATKVSPYWGEN